MMERLAAGNMRNEAVVGSGRVHAGVLSSHEERLKGGGSPGPETGGCLEGYGSGGSCDLRFGLGSTMSGTQLTIGKLHHMLRLVCARSTGWMSCVCKTLIAWGTT